MTGLVKGWYNAVLREPLSHCLLAGTALFALYQWVVPDGAEGSDDVIVVDRATLLTHIQYRTKAFQPEVAARRLAAMSTQELERLIAGYVREEALHREALALGMDADDYIIKRRLIQKVEFLAQGFADAAGAPDEEALQAYFEQHRADYAVEPLITFTHVFFDADRRGADAARNEAEQELVRLNAAAVAFSDAPGRGDRFAYHRNYVERTPDFVASHFGQPMAQHLFSIAAGDGTWRGPYDSPYGSHLVLISRSQPGRLPELDEVRGRVADDARRTLARQRLDAALDRIVAGYEVRQTYRHQFEPARLASQVTANDELETTP